MVRTVLLIVIGGLFTVAGIGLLILGKPEDRANSIICTLFFGTCLLAGLGQLFRGKGASGMTLAQVPWEGASRPALLLGPSTSTIVVQTLGAAGMAVSCAGMAVFADRFPGPFDMGPGGVRIIGVTGALFFGFVACVSPFRVPRQGIALTSCGIALLGAVPTLLRWEVIREIALFDFEALPMSKQTFLGLRLTPEAVAQAKEPLAKAIRTNRKLHGWDLAYPMQTLQATPRTVEILAQYYLCQPDARPQLGTPTELERWGKMLSGG